MGFFTQDEIANNSTELSHKASLWYFNLKIHMDWVRYVCGRIKSDYRYSNEIVYNNFPFPLHVNEVLEIASKNLPKPS